nr:hypothetical protein [Thiomonas sp.]
MAAPNEAGYKVFSSANVQQKIQNGDFQGAIQTARSELNDKIKGKTDSLVSSHQGLTASNQGIVDAIKQSSTPTAQSGPANNSGGSGKGSKRTV